MALCDWLNNSLQTVEQVCSSDEVSVQGFLPRIGYVNLPNDPYYMKTQSVNGVVVDNGGDIQMQDVIQCPFPINAKRNKKVWIQMQESKERNDVSSSLCYEQSKALAVLAEWLSQRGEHQIQPWPLEFVAELPPL
ncbi:hypothetical protein DAPPUDRAFT_109868 [Daphnia pulex]|uniref:Uncharacterized protein n=1 Tax=Daphnia pulex TaxID=6669 RepID=E9H4G3_DAPPU|nr:hypothetical protein DAPPUDRAFT_109868 [Daphnia pulex]|eukprot:EFX73404.1 hypothetical protein DAPPUDRAFT_109868 [Daphnia pulex]